MHTIPHHCPTLLRPAGARWMGERSPRHRGCALRACLLPELLSASGASQHFRNHCPNSIKPDKYPYNHAKTTRNHCPNCPTMHIHSFIPPPHCPANAGRRPDPVYLARGRTLVSPTLDAPADYVGWGQRHPYQPSPNGRPLSVPNHCPTLQLPSRTRCPTTPAFAPTFIRCVCEIFRQMFAQLANFDEICEKVTPVRTGFRNLKLTQYTVNKCVTIAKVTTFRAIETVT